MAHHLHRSRITRGAVLALATLITLLLGGCTTPPPALSPEGTTAVTLIADGAALSLSTQAATVRAFLEEAGVTLSPTDEVDPPLFTPLNAGMTVRVVRVTESIETIERGIPFGRRIVRNETMGEDDPPQILQAGRSGLEELTVRIVYRDGIEAERRVTQVTIIEESQDEIVMIGLGLSGAADITSFDGLIAAINGGGAVLLRGSSAFPEQINTGSGLDRRVFALSPNGSHLLYTRVTTGTNSFNALYIVSTARNATPRPLGIENVLWADWNPARTAPLEIAYTTGTPTALSPGWEANNDLWLGEMPRRNNDPFTPRKLVDSYPATYGWWGGNYAWAPTGDQIGYSFADEVGVIPIDRISQEEAFRSREQLLTFVEYDTRADWVWVPSLSWSPDGRFLAFTRHSGENPTAGDFDAWIVDVETGAGGRLSPGVGIWGYTRWSPAENGDTPITFLRASDPLDSLRSSYTLWRMDSDGSNQEQIFPPAGENSFFPRQERFMAWKGDGSQVAFVFDDDLYLLDLETNAPFLLLEDDATASHPSWAPYGGGLTPTPAAVDRDPDRIATPLPPAARQQELPRLPDAP